MKRTLLGTSLALLLCPDAWAQTNGELAQQLRETEAAFAKTMADRDYQAFVSFLAEDAVFFTRRGLRRGKQSVAAEWKTWYEGKQAPFSWTPEQTEVLASGELGLSSGPVFDPAGRRIGVFNSIWRREKDGKWKIVFDKGCNVCDSEKQRPAQ